MFEGKKVLGLIPARGGSKGLPRKNILPLQGKPLIAWSVQAAQGSRWLDRTVISTEDNEIASVARSWGGEVPFMRPDPLATDEAKADEVALHALGALQEDFDYLVLLQPTSPLRNSQDIDACIEKAISTKAPSCVTVTPQPKSPAWMFTLGENDRLVHAFATQDIKRRQEYPSLWVLNGAVYVVAVPWLKQHHAFIGEESLGHVMPPERSADIDTLYDFHVASGLISALGF